MAVGLIGAGVSLIGGLIQGFGARKRAKAAMDEYKDFENEIKSLESSRQTIIDPYRGIKDLSNMVTNPYENLQVATAAAEMRAAEQDISLATTLDTLRATGAGAGGATALAQAASRSKANIAADIQKQEMRNVELRAKGEQQMQMLQMREAARVQGARAAGEKFMFGARESRQMQKLDRVSAMAAGARRRSAAYGMQASQGFGSALGAGAGILAGGLIGGEGFGKNLINNLG